MGVEKGIALAVAASIIDHLRHTSHPNNSLLVKSPAGHWQPAPVRPGARTEEGLAVYRFGTSLYYANAGQLLVTAGDNRQRMHPARNPAGNSGTSPGSWPSQGGRGGVYTLAGNPGAPTAGNLWLVRAGQGP